MGLIVGIAVFALLLKYAKDLVVIALSGLTGILSVLIGIWFFAIILDKIFGF